MPIFTIIFGLVFFGFLLDGIWRYWGVVNRPDWQMMVCASLLFATGITIFSIPFVFLVAWCAQIAGRWFA